jgi:hypothetical protein
VADQSAGLQVIDISDPSSPALAGSYDTPGSSYDVVVSGDHACVADYGAGLQVINVSDPANPTLAGTYDTPDVSYGVVVSGDHAYVAVYNAGLCVIDISDPTNPALAGTYDTPGHAEGVAVAGDYAYVADHEIGLQVIDISDPTNPVLAGAYDAPFHSYYYEVAVVGDYAFVAVGSGLQIMDISDPANPTPVGEFDTRPNARAVAIAGNYAYVGEYDHGVEIIRVFERSMIVGANTGQSLVISSGASDIGTVKITSSQTGSIQWEVSADSGANWQLILPDGAWNLLENTGVDLLWRSTHVYSHSQPDLNPTCTQLDVDWLFLYPYIVDIVDVPNDQGRQVRISWSRSGNDCDGSTAPVIEYAVYRKIDTGLSAPTTASSPILPTAKQEASVARVAPAMVYPPGDWHFVLTVPARAEETYTVTVPTLADSTITEGMYYTAFFVSALTETLGVYFDSPPDSGYSVDNLPPIAPQGFAISYNTGSGNQLAWEECPQEDFQFFSIYREETDGFVPSSDNLVHVTVGTDWLDTVADGWKYCYKVTAIDHSGNESDAASGTATGIETPSIPLDFALYQNVPNPFNPNTTIAFDVPNSAPVRLTIYDVSGALVRVLVDRDMSPGRKQVAWDGKDSMGRSVASGVYFYRLDTPTFSKSRKMIMLR